MRSSSGCRARQTRSGAADNRGDLCRLGRTFCLCAARNRIAKALDWRVKLPAMPPCEIAGPVARPGAEQHGPAFHLLVLPPHPSELLLLLLCEKPHFVPGCGLVPRPVFPDALARACAKPGTKQQLAWGVVHGCLGRIRKA